jgi:hypothetical protein
MDWAYTPRAALIKMGVGYSFQLASSTLANGIDK